MYTVWQIGGDYIPFILKEEESRLQNEIANVCMSVIFDGTCRFGEAHAIVVHFISDDCTIEKYFWCILLTGKETVRELISVLSTTYRIQSETLMAAMRDRTSVNDVAMRTLYIVFPQILDIGCFLTHLIMSLRISTIHECQFHAANVAEGMTVHQQSGYCLIILYCINTRIQ